MRGPQLRRLYEEIGDITSEIGQPGSTERKVEAWRSSAWLHVNRATEAARLGDLDTAWGQAYRARECQVLGYDPAKVILVASELRDELQVSKKFVEWRRVAALALLNPIPHELKGGALLRAKDRRSRLYEAVRIRNESFANEYRRLTILRCHQKKLLYIGLGALALLIADLILNASSLRDATLDRVWLMLAAILLGIVGAVTSAAQRSARISNQRIPEQLGSDVASISRIPIGAVAGLLVWLVGNAGVSPAASSAAYLLVGAFGAGFTERLVAPQRDGDK